MDPYYKIGTRYKGVPRYMNDNLVGRKGGARRARWGGGRGRDSWNHGEGRRTLVEALSFMQPREPAAWGGVV